MQAVLVVQCMYGHYRRAAHYMQGRFHQSLLQWFPKLGNRIVGLGLLYFQCYTQNSPAVIFISWFIHMETVSASVSVVVLFL